MFGWIFGKSAADREEAAAAERTCALYTKALSTCLEANKEGQLRGEKEICAGLAGSAAHCLGSKLAACQESAKEYSRCITKHGLQPNGGSDKCTREEKALFRCIKKKGVGRGSGLERFP